MKLTLRFYISTLIGLAVVCISATVIAIVSTLYSQAATKLGVRYANQLGAAGSSRVEEYMLEMYEASNSLANSLLQRFGGNFTLPIDDPSLSVDDYCTEAKTIIKLSNGTISTAIIVFRDDRSMFSAIPLNYLPNGTQVTRCGFASAFNSSSTGHTTVEMRSYDYNTNFRYNDTAFFEPFFGADKQTGEGPVSVQPPQVVAARGLAERFTKTFWPPPSAYVYIVGLRLGLIFPATTPIRDSFGVFKGTATVNIDAAVLTQFLTELNLGEKSHAFIIHQTEMIIATTYPSSLFTAENTTLTTASGTGCVNTHFADPTRAINTIYCPRFVPAFDEFPPLQQLLAEDKTVFSTPVDFEREFVFGSDVYYISNHKINNPGALFGMTASFFIYFNDVVDSINNSRNIVIGVGVGILVASVAICVALIIVLLSPLETVSMQMNATSQLRLAVAKKIGMKSGGDQDDGNEDQQQLAAPTKKTSRSSTSGILEIYFLQKAYSNLNNAVDAFTRYTPKDIVKNLMSTGQLTRNRSGRKAGSGDATASSVNRGLTSMSHANATILCSDIQGFTSLCERQQDPRELSDVLGIFFEEMSSIIMNHEGVIIQYIGDAIVAAWGALTPSDFQQVKACLAALLMTRETCMPTLTAAFESIGESISVRIGINSGKVLCGILGSQDRIGYSVFGQAADLASNLEAWNKKFDSRVLVSESVAKEVERFMLVRCVYSTRKAASEEELEQQPGVFVVTPEDAKEYWKENSKRILRRRRVSTNAPQPTGFARRKSALPATDLVVSDVGEVEQRQEQLQSVPSAASTTADNATAEDNNNSALTSKTATLNSMKSDDTMTTTMARRDSSYKMTEASAPASSDNDMGTKTLTNDNGVQDDDDQYYAHLLCFELLGLLPDNRLDLSELSRVLTNTSSVVVSRSNNTNNNVNTSTPSATDDDDYGDDEATFSVTGEGMSTFSGGSGSYGDDSGQFTESGELRLSSQGQGLPHYHHSGAVGAGGVGAGGGSAPSVHSSMQSVGSGGGLHHSYEMKSELAKIKLSKKRRQQLRERRARRGRSFLQLFNDAIQNSNESCSLIASEAEIEFATRYSRLMLTRFADAASFNSAIGELMDDFPLFFKNEEDFDANHRRLSEALAVVGWTRCPAFVLNAKSKPLEISLQ